MNVPANLKYTKSHEWVRAEPDGTVTVGITDHAQDLLGDLVFIAAADVYAPLAGVVTEFNTAVADAPELVNQDAYAAWLFRMKPTNMADMDALLDAAAYIASAGE